MKDKIIKILAEHRFTLINERIQGKVADEILKMAEFEALGNPDIYEAHMNEHFESEFYPKEFIEWLSGKELTYRKGKYYQDSDTGYREFTIDELYEYWKDLPKTE